MKLLNKLYRLKKTYNKMDNNENNRNTAIVSPCTSTNGGQWVMFGDKIPKPQIVFLCQMIILLTVIISV